MVSDNAKYMGGWLCAGTKETFKLSAKGAVSPS